MSKLNIEKVIEEIFSHEKNLIEFFSCENQDELYNYCISKGTGYTREEFDEFIEETISKANCEAILNEEIIESLDPNKEVSSLGFDKGINSLDSNEEISYLDSKKEINQNSLSDEGAKTFFGKKIRQAFTKVLAAGLAVFSVAPVVQNLIPSAAQAIGTAGLVDKKAEKKKVLDKGFGSKIKNLSNVEKVELGVGALSAIALSYLGITKGIPAIFGGTGGSNAQQANDGGQRAPLQNKIVLLGDTQSGKTSLVNRITTNCFNESYCPTIKVSYDCKKYNINEQEVEHNFWDIFGQEKYRYLISEYFLNAGLLIFTISLKEDEFEKQIKEVREFFEIFEKSAPENAKGIVVMTKSDLEGKVSIEYAKTQIESQISSYTNGAIKNRVTLFETPVSAKTGKNVDKLEEHMNQMAIEISQASRSNQ